jgi:hypothetical protein
MDDLNFAICNGATDPECHRIDWNGSTIIFNVSHFTTYSINESPCTPVTFYRDADVDGYGNLSLTILSCIPVSGYVSDSTDCNDNNSAVKPGASEICDGLDNDCDNQTDEGGVCPVPSSGGGGGTRPRNVTKCVEDWVCGNWSECTNGKQTRTCSDKSSCGTVIAKPANTKTCKEEAAAPVPTIPPVSATNFAAWIIWAIMALLSIALRIELIILTRRRMGMAEGYWEKQIGLASKNLQSHQ